MICVQNFNNNIYFSDICGQSNVLYSAWFNASDTLLFIEAWR